MKTNKNTNKLLIYNKKDPKMVCIHTSLRSNLSPVDRVASLHRQARTVIWREGLSAKVPDLPAKMSPSLASLAASARGGAT